MHRLFENTGLGQLDASNADPAVSQRDRYPAGTDAELDDRAATAEPGQEVDGRVENVRIEQLRQQPGVVADNPFMKCDSATHVSLASALRAGKRLLDFLRPLVLVDPKDKEIRMLRFRSSDVLEGAPHGRSGGWWWSRLPTMRTAHSSSMGRSSI
jgi:hypothetical protein